MIIVRHVCGHEQQCRFDELAARLVAKGMRTEEYAATFIAEQRRWLEVNLCPNCYCAAKAKNPNTRPVDPPTPENILQRAAMDVLDVLKKSRSTQ